MSRAININSPGVRSMMAAAFSSEAGLTADELADRAGITKGTAATYIAPLLAMGMLHISGWRTRSDGQNNFVREYMPGPQDKDPPPRPDPMPSIHEHIGEAPPIPHDPILFALLGIAHTERNEAA